MTTSHESASSEGPREFVLYRDRNQAAALTLKALHNVGFVTETDPTKIDRERFKPRTGDDTQIAATFTNPTTGLRVEAGIKISDIDMNWPYNWTGQAVDPTKAEQILYQTGNNDNNQPEFMGELVQLLAYAQYGRPHPWTDEYKEWKRKIDEQLAPLYGEDQQ